MILTTPVLVAVLAVATALPASAQRVQPNSRTSRLRSVSAVNFSARARLGADLRAISPRVQLRPGLLAQPAVRPNTPRPAAGPGQLQCTASRNGTRMPARYTLTDAGGESFSGRCGPNVTIPAGRYEAVITLEGNENRAVAPKRQHVVIETAETANLAVEFEVAILEVRLLKGFERIPGSADIYQNGRLVASTADGRGLFITPGSYEVHIRATAGYHSSAGYVSGERRMAVSLQAGQRRALRARF